MFGYVNYVTSDGSGGVLVPAPVHPVMDGILRAEGMSPDDEDSDDSDTPVIVEGE